ncbi:hypothetical protein BKA70DRAFT_1558740 [Coprinopsis sp. MPI-PUGE-AT-0042]|nr:hypothetical protein BKA70DRAFT_1558740 [Coprinopsis sp. MPI-PUGE-AT-0042]
MDREWFPGVPKSSKAQQTAFDTMSSMDDLSDSPSAGRQTVGAATSRHSWKLLKGKPEAVWPPALEGALIEALEEYRKMEVRPTTSKYGVRYPMRNRFISDFILEKTGKTRSAKQVGIRLQQLQDTRKDGPLSSLLGGFQHSNSPSPSPEETMVIHVQLECVSQPQGGPTPAPQVHLRPNDTDTPHHLYLVPISRHWSDPLPPAHPTPSSTLSSFSSFIELVSSFPLSEETTWSAYRDNTLVHQERTELRMASFLPAEAGRHLYVCDLVPSLWPVLCESEDPTYITIVQKVRSARDSSLLSVKEASIVYQFNVPDYTKHKLRPTTSSYAATASYPAPLPSTSSHTYHPSRSSVPNYGSSSQGYGYWPSSSQGLYGYRDTGYHPGHRRMHDPSLAVVNPSQSIGGRQDAADSSPWRQDDHVGSDVSPNSFYAEPRANQWDTNGHRSFPFSNLPDNGATNPRDGRHNHSHSTGGPSVFGHSTNIAVNNSHIKMDLSIPILHVPTSHVHYTPLWYKDFLTVYGLLLPIRARACRDVRDLDLDPLPPLLLPALRLPILLLPQVGTRQR